MASTTNLIPGVFKIYSVLQGSNPVTGVDYTKQALQTVRLDEPVQAWKSEQVGSDVYRLSLGDYVYTGVVNDKVTASTHQEDDVKWYVNYREDQRAYTIELADDRDRVWTVSREDSPHPEILIRPLVPYSPAQLFQLEALD